MNLAPSIRAASRLSATRAVLIVLLVGVFALTTAVVVSAQETHNATRLGGSATSFSPPVRDLKALKRVFAKPAMQKDVRAAFAEAGMDSLADKFLQAIADGTPDTIKDSPYPVGDTLVWMASRDPRNRKPHLLRNVRWSGKKPFPAWEITLEEGYKIYTFVLPKACMNFSLGKVTEKPLPECVTVAVERDCVKKTMTARATGASISGNQITRVEMSRDGSKVTDLLPTQGFSYSGALQPGRYSFKAFDQYDREVPICNTQPLTVEACPAPPPPPPPPPPASCALTASAVKGKAGWDVTVDGSGCRNAKQMTFEIVDPAGKVVPFTYEGKTQSAATLGPPFQGTVTIKKLAAGTYTVRGKVENENAKAAGASCEATFTIVPEEKIGFFFGGYFGKERRVRETGETLDNGEQALYGYCAPLIGLKAGVPIKVSDVFEVAPAFGVAINLDKGSNTSAFAELELNRVYEKGFFGTGIGVWDFTHSGTIAPTLLLNWGQEIWRNQKKNRLFFNIEGRLFLADLGDLSNNYQFWGGLRYRWR
jgi:hypothetical protein